MAEKTRPDNPQKKSFIEGAAVLLYQKARHQKTGEFICSSCGKVFPTNDARIAVERFRVHRCELPEAAA